MPLAHRKPTHRKPSASDDARCHTSRSLPTPAHCAPSQRHAMRHTRHRSVTCVLRPQPQCQPPANPAPSQCHIAHPTRQHSVTRCSVCASVMSRCVLLLVPMLRHSACPPTTSNSREATTDSGKSARRASQGQRCTRHELQHQELEGMRKRDLESRNSKRSKDRSLFVRSRNALYRFKCPHHGTKARASATLQRAPNERCTCSPGTTHS